MLVLIKIVAVALVFTAAPKDQPEVASRGLNQPPPGFTAIFNGKDIKGWWGLGTENPAKWMALSPADLAKKKAESLTHPKKGVNHHWSVKNGILINDGNGHYLSTAKNYADFELLVDYKTVAKADSGIYLRGVPQVQIWDTTKAGNEWKLGADKGSGGLWNNSKGAAGKDPDQESGEEDDRERRQPEAPLPHGQGQAAEDQERHRVRQGMPEIGVNERRKRDADEAC